MIHKIDISERDENFTLASSLSDTPYTDENSMIRVCIFYLGQNGKPGGDTFKVKGDVGVAVSLLGDLSEEGAEARRCLTPLISDLEKIAKIGSSYSFDTHDIAKTILNMDKKLPFPTALAFSFVRLTHDRKMHYLNIGENVLLAAYGDQKIVDLSGTSTGKVGWLELVSKGDKDSLIKGVVPYEIALVPTSKILIFTDGVRDFIGGKTPVKRRVEEIKKALLYSPSLIDCVRKINIFASDELTRRGEKLSDDYTIIGLEVK